MVEGWIRSKSGVTDEEEIQSLVRRTMVENGTWHEGMTEEEVRNASKAVAALKQTTGFKVDKAHGLYIESRQIKAGIKEATNILYADQRWGPTKKGPKAFLAERVFVSPDRLYLGTHEPAGVELMIGQVNGPQGRRSTLGYHEYVEEAVLEFDVLVARDAIEQQWWVEIWSLMEENGIGALRSQGYGRFDILAWDKVDLISNAPGSVQTRKNGRSSATSRVLAR